MDKKITFMVLRDINQMHFEMIFPWIIELPSKNKIDTFRKFTALIHTDPCSMMNGGRLHANITLF